MKRILLVLFFGIVLKAGAQGRIEASLGAGPYVFKNNDSLNVGKGFRSTLGYEFSNKLVVFGGIEFVSLPIGNEFYNLKGYSNDTKRPPYTDLGEVGIIEKFASISAYHLGLRMPLMRTGSIIPYISFGAGFTIITRTHSYIEGYQYYPDGVMGKDEGTEVLPMQLFGGAGIDFKVGDDKSLFIESGLNYFEDNSEIPIIQVEYYTTPIRAGLKMWF